MATSVGVPTVGGELTFDPVHGNPLVNVLCMGALPIRPPGVGHRLGAKQLANAVGQRHRA